MSHPPQALMLASNHPPEEGWEGKEELVGRAQCLSNNAQDRLACTFMPLPFSINCSTPKQYWSIQYFGTVKRNCNCNTSSADL